MTSIRGRRAHVDESALRGLGERIGAVLDGVVDGVTVQDPEGRLVYANLAAAELIGFDTVEALLAEPVASILARFEMFDESGEPLEGAHLPGRMAMRGHEPPPLTVRFRSRVTGEERWSIVQARPLRDFDGGVDLVVNTFHDITHRVEAETDLRESEAMYRQLSEALPTIAWATDAEGRLRHANSRWLEYAGRAPLPGSPIQGEEIIHPDDRDDLRKRWNAALATAEPFEATCRVRRHDGEYRWHLMRAVPVREEAGQLRGWVGTSTDIEDTMRAHSRTEEAERRYRDLVESIDAIVWEADPATLDFGFVSPRAVDLLGHHLDRWTGGPGFWTSIVHPEDRAVTREVHRAAARSGRETAVEFRAIAADGRIVWLRDMVYVVAAADGHAAKLRGIMVDVSDRKRAEDAQRVLADASKALDTRLDLHATVETAARVAVPAIADACVVVLTADGTSRVHSAVARADAAHDELADALDGATRDLRARHLTSSAIREGRPILVADPADAAAEPLAGGPKAARALRRRVTSAMAIPLRARDRVVGAMVFATGPSGRRFGRDDLELGAELAVRVAMAITNAELYAAEQGARAAAEAATSRTGRLRELARALSDARSVEDAATAALRAAGEVVRAGQAFLGLTGETGIDVLAAATEGKLAPPGRTRLGGGSGLAGIVARGQPVWPSSSSDAETASTAERAGASASAASRVVAATNGRSKRPVAVPGLLDLESVAVVPLRHEDRSVGVLALGWADARTLADGERTFLLALADETAQAIERIRLVQSRELLLSDLDAQRSRLEAILEQMPEGVIIAEAPSGRLALGNRQVERIWRMPIVHSETIDAYDAYPAFHADGRLYEAHELPLARAIERGETVEGEEVEIQRGDGTRGWIVVNAAPVRGRDGRIVAGVVTFADVTERRQAEAERRFLADAASILASSLDYEAAIVRVASLAVPRIGDWCVVEIVDDEGRLRPAAIAHADPALAEAAIAMAERGDGSPVPMGAPEVVASGRSQVIPDLAAHLGSLAGDAEHRDFLRGLELRSSVSVPLVAEGRPIGAITFVGAESGRRYSAADLPFAELLAARIAAAVQHARLYRDADRYRRVLDASLDTVVLLEPDTLRFSYANRGAVDRLGYERDELLAMGPLDVTIDLDEAGFRALIAPLVERRREALTVTLTHRTKDGQLTPVEVLLQYVEPAGAPGRIVAVARDIGERVEAQARLQRLAEAEHARAAELNAVLQAMGDGVVVCDADGWITLANPAAEEIFPNTTERTYADILAQVEDPDGAAPRLGHRDPPVELRVKGAEERWVEISTYPTGSAPAGDASTRPSETIVLLRDVTVARQRQAVRDTFVGVLSHELRTPVTTIYAGSKILARDASTIDPEVRAGVFEDIQAEAERLHRLVEDVVALTRFGEEDADIGQEPVLLQRVLPGVVRSEEARWPGVTFEVDIPRGLPTVGADPTYLEQVLRNFLSNAAKYGGPGATVRVIVEPDDEEVSVRILDDGPGFPAVEAERLFDLFFRSPSTATAASGAGIGLFVCARLVRAMRGRVWARPREDRGAEFGFTLRVMTDA